MIPLQLNNLPLLISATIIRPLDHRCAICGRTAIYVERLPAVAVGYLVITKTLINDAPLLIVTATVDKFLKEGG